MRSLIRKFIERFILILRIKAQKAASTLEARREYIAKAYLKGNGIEIGALQRPLKIPQGAYAKYVDRMTVAELRKQYAELASEKLVEADIIDDGEKLATIANDSQDFVIANHIIEHCQDPIGAIGNMLRVLMNGGILYLAIPDKRYSPDCDRPITSNEHLLKDHHEGPAWSKRQHFEEWVRLWVYERVQGDDQVEKRIKELIDIDYSIHYHVWTSEEFVGFLMVLKQELNKESKINFEIENFLKNDSEVIAILKKMV